MMPTSPSFRSRLAVSIQASGTCGRISRSKKARPLEEIEADIRKVEQEILTMLREVAG